MPGKRTIVYIDGFNLYHRALKGSPHRWLDLVGFAHSLLPRNDVHLVRYFTAHVKPLRRNPQGPVRQDVYLKALSTLQGLQVHEGLFKMLPGWREPDKQMRSMMPRPEVLKVTLPDEKGSDVNLASWLLLDGFRGDYEVAVVVSNDSDLTEPVRLVHDELGLDVGIVNPDSKSPDQLVAQFTRSIRPWMLAQNQLPNPIQVSPTVTVHKPLTW